jgi:hypothetical protein
MPKVKPLLVGAVCLMSVIFYGIVGLSQTPQPSVKLSTDPPIAQLAPFEAESETYDSPATLTLQAVDAAGQPLANAKIHLKILTPPKTPWLTTDFPIVEGTTLLELDAIAPEGKVQLQPMLPIRGTYQLQVEVNPQVANAFTPFQNTLTLSIPENWVKYQNFAILVTVLLAVGLGGGWIIGGQQRIHPGEIPPQQVRLLLSGVTLIAIAALLYVNVSAEIAQSELAMPMSHRTDPAPRSDNPAIQQHQGLKMQISGDAHAVVGEPAKWQVRVINAQTQQPVSDVQLNITATQLENHWIALNYVSSPDASGQIIWQQQFFDGAPHKVEAEVAPLPNSARQFKPFKVAQTIEVEGVAPPLQVRLITLTYFSGIVAIAFLIGFQLRLMLFRQGHRTTPSI